FSSGGRFMSLPDSTDELLNLFRNKKVEISLAIKHRFPFLHGLRDKGIITEETFKMHYY
uniref:HSR domain-containing protein n=1 Tax=Salvator merianae TaxID=96440 RepID=A0A8D0E9V8_SALMN